MNLTLEGLVMALPTRRVGPLDLTISPGITWLRGPNGSGKTTLLRVLCAELAPTAGTVRLDGREPARDPSARRRISFLPAVPELSGFLSTRECWALMAGLRGTPSWDGAALAERLGIDPDRRIDALSVGQRRKAELLAALAGDPDVLLLDEVFAPLDTASVAMLAGILRARSRIVVVTGHGGLPMEADRTVDL